MDGLSAATAVIALIQVTAKLISICWEYKGLKGATRAAKRLIDQLEGLKVLLVEVDEGLDGQKPLGSSHRRTLSEWATSERLGVFRETLQRLVQQLQPSEGIRSAKETILFPLRQRNLEEALEELERMKSSLNLALTVDQTVRLGDIATSVLDVRHEQEMARDEKRAHMIHKWLAAPHMAVNQAQKQSERQGDTGIWLLRLPIFQQWLVRPNTLLWIHDIPGSGKSVLCSTIHQHALESVAVGVDKIAICFYFDVAEESKRSTDNMLRSLISQLAFRKERNKVLNDIYDGCRHQRHAVTRAQLLTIMFDLLDDYIDVLISIDGIDEAADVQESMQTILQIHRRKLNHVHVMLTSRWAQAFEVNMVDAGANVVELSGVKVEHDISTYVEEKLAQGQKWPEAIRTNLSERIIHRAGGL
jgi:hypothetical protein